MATVYLPASGVLPCGKEARFVAAGDFNGDHKTDLVVADYTNNDLVVLLNTGVVSLSPTTPVNYPFQLVGTTSPQRNVILTNNGTTALTISSIAAHGRFQVRNTCGKTVAAGAKCTISVAFKPTTTGRVTGTVSIADSASSKPQIIELVGTGTVAKISPLNVTFGPQAVGTTSPPQNITLTNEGRPNECDEYRCGGQRVQRISREQQLPTVAERGRKLHYRGKLWSRQEGKAGSHSLHHRYRRRQPSSYPT